MKAYSVDWSLEAASERERMVRETFLAREMSNGLDGLVTIVLLARRWRHDAGGLAIDLDAAESYALATLTDALGEREASGLDAAERYVEEHGAAFAAPPRPVAAPDDTLISAIHHRRPVSSNVERFLQTG